MAGAVAVRRDGEPEQWMLLNHNYWLAHMSS